MSEEEKWYSELEENYEKIVEMLSNGNFLQLNGKAINLTELNEYINAQQEEIERLNNIIGKAIGLIYDYQMNDEENVNYKELLNILKGSDKNEY